MLYPTPQQRRLLPISLGMLFIGLTFWNFLRIGQDSHSVSDMLLNFIPQTTLSALLAAGMLYLFTRLSRRRQDNN